MIDRVIDDDDDDDDLIVVVVAVAAVASLFYYVQLSVWLKSVMLYDFLWKMSREHRPLNLNFVADAMVIRRLMIPLLGFHVIYMLHLYQTLVNS